VGLKAESRAGIEWLLEGEPTWPEGRVVSFPAPQAMQYANVPLYRHPAHAGVLTRYRLRLDHAAGAEIDLKSLIAAIDTRHPITNVLFLRGCGDYFAWTRDVEFLRQNIGRMRKALHFALKEFRVREEKHVFVPWVGHDGRSGLVIGPDGQKSIRAGLGVGNNYYDLVPFGAHDAMATTYLHDALRAMAALEKCIQAHAEWQIPADGTPFDAQDLTTLADAVRTDFQKRFWNAETGRFNGWIDVTGRAYDFGFTFVNLEAIYYGLASPEQARSILDWLDGKREIAADTSRGADIYHWRFAPRAHHKPQHRHLRLAVVEPRTNPLGWPDPGRRCGARLQLSRCDGATAHQRPRRCVEATARDPRLVPRGAKRRRLPRLLRQTRPWHPPRRRPRWRPRHGPGVPRKRPRAASDAPRLPRLASEPPMATRAHPRLPKNWPSLTISGIRFQDRVLTITADADGRVEVKPGETHDAKAKR